MPDTPAPLPADKAAPDRDAASSFVGYLHRLYVRRERDGSARAALAELRHSATDSSGRYGALSVVGQHIPGVGNDAFDAYLLTAELFGIYAAGGTEMPDAARLPEYRRSLGASARLVNGRRIDSQGDAVDENAGITRRFEALLALPFEDLPGELRRFLRLLRSKDAPVNFNRLLRDLLAWERSERSVQRRWARDYWPSALANDSTDPEDA